MSAFEEQAKVVCRDLRLRASRGEASASPETYALAVVELAEQWYAVNPHEEWQRANVSLKHEARELRQRLADLASAASCYVQCSDLAKGNDRKMCQDGLAAQARSAKEYLG